MLVYGDHARTRAPHVVIAELRARLRALDGEAPGIARHAHLVTTFIETGALAQGLADAETALRGRDARGPLGDTTMTVLLSLARAIAASWQGGTPRPELAARVLELLDAAALPDAVTLKRAEGYAFYAVYPEAYLLAARRAIGRRPGPRRVIGIRSIGCGLAALVATTARAPLPATVRPVGDAFRRTLNVDRSLIAEWTADRTATIAIVDEGPGYSGSSFGAVADTLEEHGIPTDRIECYPSHRNDLGPAAHPRHRERWQHLRRHLVDVDELLLASGRLARWVAELVGPLVAPFEDLSAGAWRAHHFADEAAWPPSVLHQERRKLLARTADARWLVRFVGLGLDGEHAIARARTLHAAGFTPEPRGLVHGFLVERWLDRARPLAVGAVDRARVVDRVGRYLAFRASALPANRASGASAAALLVMARRNVELGLDAAAAATLDRWAPRVAQLDAGSRRIEIDGRMHVWEWLVDGGELVKTDALDHHAAHDLVGCQDVTWDIAGAAVELALSFDEQRRVAAIIEHETGRAIDPELLAFHRTCYLAFQLGRHALAADIAGPAEAARLRAARDRYALLLRRVLQSADDAPAAAARLDLR